jgi:hypothetical protein
MTQSLHGVPDTVEGNQVRKRIHDWLTKELDGRQTFAADYNDAVVVVALEDDKAALYRFRAPQTVSRELLHLDRAVVCIDHELGDKGRDDTHLSIDLRGKGELRVHSKTIASADLDELRAELEKRTTRLGH